MAKKKRSKEELAAALPYMVFDLKRGYVWGPARSEEIAGTLPYWNTGKIASWSEEAIAARKVQGS